jgi:SAP domain
MTLYARSDLMSVSIPVTSGGCGHTHSRPVHKGAPARDFRLDCPGCENFLKGGGRKVLHVTQGSKELGIPTHQEWVADCDPCWAATPESVPDTPDERQYVAKKDKIGHEELEMINALAAAKQAGIDIPQNAMDLLNRRLPNALINAGQAQYHAEPEYGLEDLSVNKLKAMCKEQGLPTSGTRAQLIERLS